MTEVTFNPDAIPEELTERDQWLLWDASADAPRRPHWRGDFGVSWTDPDDWHGFDEAVAAAEERGSWGIGYVFANGSDEYARGLYGALDLDGCVDDEGQPKDWLPSLQPFFDADAYMELSPSGEGIHVPLAGFEPPAWWRDVHFTDEEHEGVEAYDKKFFTFTGDRLRGAGDEVADAGGYVDDWLAEAYEAVEGEPPQETGADTPESYGDDVNVRVHDVLLRSNYPEGERREHPVHGSGTGTNFMVDEGGETWRCWRHGCTGNALHLVGMQAGIIECGQWDTGHVSTGEWADIFDVARERGLDVPPPESAETPTSAPAAAQDGVESDGGVEAAQAGESGGYRSLQERVATEVLTPLDPPEDYEGEEITYEVALDRFTELLLEEYAFVRPRRDVRGWRDTLYVYVDDGGIYEPHGESFIEHEAERLLGPVATNQRCKEIVSKIERKSLVRPGELAADPHRLVVDNGIVDLHTGELEPHTPEEYHRVRLDWAYNPEGECDRIDDFFHEIVADHDVTTLYQLVAHCIYKEYIAEKAAMLLGDGQNGKSVYLAMIEEFLGEYNVSRRSLQDFADNDFAANNLEGKLANLHPDMASEAVDELGVFKQLTGRDTLVADVKYERPIQFENHATLIFAANRMPKMQEDTHALWRRWIYVNFPYTFSEHKEDAKDPIPKRELMAELTTAEEMQGLLSRAVDELVRWHETGTLFTNVAGPEQVRRKMKRASEPIYDFAMSCLTVDEDAFVPKDHVRQAYREYAREEGLPTIADNQFGERLLNVRDLPIESGQRRKGGKRIHVYNGVKLSSRGRQVLGLDEEEGSDDENLDDAEPRWERVVQVTRELQTSDESPARGMILGRLTGEMSLQNAERAFEKAKSEYGAIYETTDGKYRAE